MTREKELFLWISNGDLTKRCTRIGVKHISVGDWKSKRSETEKCYSAGASDEGLKRRKKNNERYEEVK